MPRLTHKQMVRKAERDALLASTADYLFQCDELLAEIAPFFRAGIRRQDARDARAVKFARDGR